MLQFLQKIKDINSNRAPALTLKKGFVRFGSFNFNNQIRSGRPTGNNNDFIRDSENRNSKFSTEKLNADRSTKLCYLNELAYTSKFDKWVLHFDIIEHT